jgi:hypothetical protein
MAKPTKLRSQACSGKFCSNLIRSSFKVLFVKKNIFIANCGRFSHKQFGPQIANLQIAKKNIGSVNPQIGKAFSLRICDLLSLFADHQPLV